MSDREHGELRTDEWCNRCEALHDDWTIKPTVAFQAYKHERLCAACLRELLELLAPLEDRAECPHRY